MNHLKGGLAILFSTLIIFGVLNLVPPRENFASNLAQTRPQAHFPKSLFKKPPEISAKSALVYDLESQMTIFSKNPSLFWQPASISKLATALVVLDYCGLEQVVTVPKIKVAGTEMGLVAGEKITVESLLYGLLLPSGNDAAYTLAVKCAPNFEQFIYSINQKVRILGMNDTRFANPAGLDQSNQRTTALDLIVLGKAIIAHPVLSQIISKSQIEVSDLTGKKIHKLENTNKLLKDSRVAGIKTGRSTGAGENLLVAAENGQIKVLIVILGSADRFGDGWKLLDWAFSSS